MGKDDKRNQDQPVGYGHPPKEHQFKPGQSGNPHGRPKGSRNKVLAKRGLGKFEETVLAHADELMTIKENGVPMEVTALDAVLKSTKLNALKGKVSAQRLILEVFADSLRRVDEKTLATAETLFEYKARMELLQQQCEANNLPFDPPGPLPHHIHIDMESGKAILLGPATRQERDREAFLKARYSSLEEEIDKLIITQGEIGEDPELDQKIAYLCDELHHVENAIPQYGLAIEDTKRFKEWQNLRSR